MMRLLGLPMRKPPPRVLDLQKHSGMAYVIGDIHGELDLLKGLEQKIIADAPPGQAHLLMCIGDMVDRGPNSYGVIEHMLAPAPKGFIRHCLMGNHEAMMLAFLKQPKRARRWLTHGGRETLFSYGALRTEVQNAERSARKMMHLVQRLVPETHRIFLRDLPHMLILHRFILNHAGGNPARPLFRQKTEDILWGHKNFSRAAAQFGKDVVHGHFRVSEPIHSDGKVAIDTGAFQTGKLTAAKLKPDGRVEFISFTRP